MVKQPVAFLRNPGWVVYGLPIWVNNPWVNNPNLKIRKQPNQVAIRNTTLHESNYKVRTKFVWPYQIINGVPLGRVNDLKEKNLVLHLCANYDTVGASKLSTERTVL